MPLQRPWAVLRREILAPRNYLALLRSFGTYQHPVQGARRYFLGSGGWPAQFTIKTPLGPVSPTLFSHNDMWTVNEVFCRRDYPVPADARVVVDVGSNIGISALWFLTRNPEVRVHCFEPVPENAHRLRQNLAVFEGRFELSESAVGPSSGEVSFGVEPSGRYGGIDVRTGTDIVVRCQHINEVIEDILSREAGIDVLKIDTEGLELRTLQALDPSLLARIATIHLEVGEDPGWRPVGFRSTYAQQTLHLTRD